MQCIQQLRGKLQIMHGAPSLDRPTSRVQLPLLAFPLTVLFAVLLPACAQDAPEKEAAESPIPVQEEVGFELLDREMIDGVEQAYLSYPSGELTVTGYLFVDPYSNQDVEPGLIFNHGGVGGVTEGTKERCRFLARQGFIVFAPSFRGEDDSEGEIEVASGEIDDVLAALAILREHPGIQRERFVMMGTSHGALISIHVAARPLGKELLRGVVAAYGVMDIYAWYRYLVENDFDVDDPLSRRVYGEGPDDKPEAFAARHALPLAEKLGPAPVLLVQGAKDRIVPADQAGRMRETLMQAGRRQDQLRVYPLGEHGFLFWDDPEKHSAEELAERNRAWSEILQFLHACLEE